MLFLLVFSICFSSDIIELDGIKEKRYTVYDQASLNTCASNAVAGALSLLDPTLLPDIHHINHYAKVCYGMVHGNMNEIDFDFGSSLISVICGVKYCGISPNTYLKNLIYEKVSPGSDFIKALKKGIPIVAGVKINGDFARMDQNGFFKYPNNIDKELYYEKFTSEGLHAITLVGHTKYNELYGLGYYKFLNSKGENWGDNGFGYLPYEYFLKLCTEAYSIRIG